MTNFLSRFIPNKNVTVRNRIENAHGFVESIRAEAATINGSQMWLVRISGKLILRKPK
ncbi:hypothetical protein IT397_03720 [Candidatus Nomurabacteria bacterium]|nr:hypothetical protein [Candidatus Nomurabacteria bacterium]